MERHPHPTTDLEPSKYSHHHSSALYPIHPEILHPIGPMAASAGHPAPPRSDSLPTPPPPPARTSTPFLTYLRPARGPSRVHVPPLEPACAPTRFTCADLVLAFGARWCIASIAHMIALYCPGNGDWKDRKDMFGDLRLRLRKSVPVPAPQRTRTDPCAIPDTPCHVGSDPHYSSSRFQTRQPPQLLDAGGLLESHLIASELCLHRPCTDHAQRMHRREADLEPSVRAPRLLCIPRWPHRMLVDPPPLVLA
ncbi:hypothetical protein C8R43DRAFT_441199 [Mycena crocata]|nr:hypothetical protein C8R43DRAFT_441199 [Mycena crocata]